MSQPDVPAASAEYDEHEPSPDRILTIPNLVTLVRLSCLPLYIWLLVGQPHRWAAAWLLFGLGCTDWVDGYIARHYNQVSELGKILDPVADRVLFFAGVGGILWVSSCPVWVAVVVLIREVLVSLGTVGLALMGAKRIDVTWFGKAGTFALMGAFPSFLASHAGRNTDTFFHWLAWGVTIPGLILGYIAAFMYVPLGLRALREGRAARTR